MAQVNPLDPAENSGIDTRASGNVIRVTTNDPNVAIAIKAGMERLVVERSTDQGLTYQEITHASERPVLEAEQFVYEFFDRCGSPSYLYRTRYAGTIKGEKMCTEASPPILGAGLAVRNILTVDDLKSRYMFGLDLTNDKGVPLEDAVYLSYIMAAIRGFEKQVDIPLLPSTFVEKHDYYRHDYHSFNFIHLDNTPVISVDEFRVQYPSGQNVIIFPGEWIRLNKLEGHVQIVPTSGTLSEILVGQGGSFLPAIYNGLDYLPHLFEVSYTAGFEDGQIPADIVNVIGMMASIGPFHIFGDLIAGAGIANISLSMDGLSQSIGTTSSATNSGYGARVGNYLKEIKAAIPLYKQYYRGLKMTWA
jgi:hypothetical protein